jgi:hypothetical protein
LRAETRNGSQKNEYFPGAYPKAAGISVSTGFAVTIRLQVRLGPAALHSEKFRSAHLAMELVNQTFERVKEAWVVD